MDPAQPARFSLRLEFLIKDADCDPRQITCATGLVPDLTQKRGDAIGKMGRSIAHHGLWVVRTEKVADASVASQWALIGPKLEPHSSFFSLLPEGWCSLQVVLWATREYPALIIPPERSRFASEARSTIEVDSFFDEDEFLKG